MTTHTSALPPDTLMLIGFCLFVAMDVSPIAPLIAFCVAADETPTTANRAAGTHLRNSISVCRIDDAALQQGGSVVSSLVISTTADCADLAFSRDGRFLLVMLGRLATTVYRVNGADEEWIPLVVVPVDIAGDVDGASQRSKGAAISRMTPGSGVLHRQSACQSAPVEGDASS